MYKFTIKICSYGIPNFLSNCHIFIENLFIFHKIHIFSFIKISFICAHFWKEFAQMSNYLIIFVTKEIFKILFTKSKLIRSYYFINIYIVN